jgi:hypothetical protein
MSIVALAVGLFVIWKCLKAADNAMYRGRFGTFILLLVIACGLGRLLVTPFIRVLEIATDASNKATSRDE